MFEEITSQTVQLVENIKRTQEYIDYVNYRSILMRHEALFNSVEEFRRRSFEAQFSHNYGVYNAYENLVHLKHDHEDLLSEPMVKMFLDAELRLSKLISEVYETLAEELDFDTQFLGD